MGKACAKVDPSAFAEDVIRDFLTFDGWKDGQPLFDFGVDRSGRLARHSGGQLPLMGLFGEIYRNLHRMRDESATIGSVISTFIHRTLQERLPPA